MGYFDEKLRKFNEDRINTICNKIVMGKTNGVVSGMGWKLTLFEKCDNEDLLHISNLIKKGYKRGLYPDWSFKEVI